jgi:hypothetical protein
MGKKKIIYHHSELSRISYHHFDHFGHDLPPPSLFPFKLLAQALIMWALMSELDALLSTGFASHGDILPEVMDAWARVARETFVELDCELPTEYCEPETQGLEEDKETKEEKIHTPVQFWGAVGTGQDSDHSLSPPSQNDSRFEAAAQDKNNFIPIEVGPPETAIPDVRHCSK